MTIVEESNEHTNESSLEPGGEGFTPSPRDMIFFNIENYFSELINFQPGLHTVDVQFKEVIEYFQRNCWDEEFDEDTKEVEQEFNYEIYCFILETFINKLMTYFNLTLQYITADKFPSSTPNLFQKTIKASCFWKVLLMDFAKVPKEASAVSNSWDAEITGSSELYDFLPATLQSQVREYLETACVKTYKTEEPIQKGLIL